MGLIVDPLHSVAAAPTVATSPDGKVTATVDKDFAGVMLTADLRSLAVPQALRNGNFSSAVSATGDANWTFFTGNTVTRNTTGGPVNNGPYLALGGPTGSQIWMQQSFTNPLPKGGRARVSFWAKVPVVANAFSVVHVDYRNNVTYWRYLDVRPGTGFWTTTWKKFTFYMDNSKAIDEAWTIIRLVFQSQPSTVAPVLHIGEITVEYFPPIGVRFCRTNRSTTEAVRGGDFKWTSSGWAKTYDGEAPLGEPSLYTAIPVYSVNEDTGPSTQGVSINVPVGKHSTWIKSLENPANSINVMINDWTAFGASSYYTAARVPGTSLPGGVWEAMGGYSGKATFVTMTDAEADKMFALVTEGIILIQTDPKYKRPTMFVVVDSWEKQDVARMDGEEKKWEISFTQIERPETSDQTTRMPRASFGQRLSNYPLFSNVPDRTFNDAMSI